MSRLFLAALAGLLAVTILTRLGPWLFSQFRPQSFSIATFLPAWIVAAVGWPSLLTYAVAARWSNRGIVRGAAFLIPAVLTGVVYVGIALWALVENVNEARLVAEVYLLATLCHSVNQTAMAAALIVVERRATAVTRLS